MMMITYYPVLIILLESVAKYSIIYNQSLNQLQYTAIDYERNWSFATKEAQ